MRRYGAAAGQCVFSSNSLFGLLCVFGSPVRMQVCFLLLIIQLHVTEGCRLEGNRDLKTITAHTGGSVLLPCSCTDLHTTPETFTWKKHINGHDWVEISPESEQYKDRFQLVNDHSSGNLSLLISQLTVEDGGGYRCRLTESEYRDISLTVEGCKLNKQTVTVTGDVGQSVLLPCSCSQLQAKPHTFRWIFSTNIDQKEIFPKDQTNRYTDRVQVFNDHHPGNLSLLISHLTVEDGGWYTCHISNSDYNDVLVTVTEGTRTPSTSTPQINTNSNQDPHRTTIIISGVVVVLLLIILGGVMCWKYRGQRRGQTEIADGQTGQRTQEKKQDVLDVPLPQDDVTYSTVICGNTVTAAHTPVASNDTTVYACIKTN